MIDLEELKPGMEVWTVHHNKLIRLKVERLEKVILASGVQYNVVDSSFLYGVPADLCFKTEMECIESQINYWRDMRLLHIVNGKAPNCS